MMKPLTVFVLALFIYGTAAIPSGADAVVPEDTLLQFQASQFEDTKQMVLEMKSQGNTAKDCRKLADSTEDSVRDNIKAEQDTLNKMAKGNQCASRGQKAVDVATDDLKKAQKKATATAKMYAKALDYRVDFGKHRFGSLTNNAAGCNVLFRSSAYTNAKAAAKVAKDAKLKAAGALDQAKRVQKTAIEDQKKALKDCYCNLKRLHAKTLKDMNVKVEKANMKAWTRAAHIRCVLDGTPIAKCKVTAIPKVKRVSLVKAAEATSCYAGPEWSKQIAVSNQRQVKCGGQTFGTPVGTVKNPKYAAYACTASYCDPFALFKKSCVKKFGDGAHQCTKIELDKASTRDLKRLTNGYQIVSCGTYGFHYASRQYGGWKYDCRSLQAGNLVGSWKTICNGQDVPCCKV